MLKGEVIPHLVRKQFVKSVRKTADKDLPHPDVSVVSLNTAANKGVKKSKNYFKKMLNSQIPSDICSYLEDNEIEEKIRSYSSWNDHRGDLRGPYQDHCIRCFAYVAKEGFCLRANTLNNYCELNRQVTDSSFLWV